MISTITENNSVTYSHDQSRDKDYIRNHHVITSVRVQASGRHDRVTIFNRGACSGEILTDAGDGVTIAKRLLDGDVR